MKTTIKKFFGLESTKKVLFLVGFFLMIFCLVGFYCCFAENHSSYVVSVASSEQISNEGGNCRQCGKQLKHKGYFCSENCRERYANEYHNERYGKAICRACGKEFIKPTAYSYFCSRDCEGEYFCDLALVSQAEEYRQSKDKVEEK